MPGTRRSEESPREKPAKNAGIALAALALGLALAEAGLRLFFPQPLAERYGSPAAGGPLVAIDPELGWTLRENVSGLASDEPWQADLATNALGFRDVDHGEKAAGVTRVAVLGDSFVFGSGVKQDEPVTRRLAALLGPSFEVINLGVPGYGTDQALLTLRRWGPRLSPDLVLVGFFWNDVMENASAEMYGMPKPRFLLAGDSLALVPPGERAEPLRRPPPRRGARGALPPLVARATRVRDGRGPGRAGDAARDGRPLAAQRAARARAGVRPDVGASRRARERGARPRRLADRLHRSPALPRGRRREAEGPEDLRARAGRARRRRLLPREGGVRAPRPPGRRSPARVPRRGEGGRTALPSDRHPLERERPRARGARPRAGRPRRGARLPGTRDERGQRFGMAPGPGPGRERASWAPG